MKKTNFILCGLIISLFTFYSCKEEIQKEVRVLPIEGAYNVRDLGGYKAANNKTVKWEKVLRSGDLNLLTDADLEYFAKLNLQTIIDFRSNDERIAAPDKTPKTLKNDYLLPIEIGDFFGSMRSLTEDTAAILLVQGNKLFVNESQKEYKEFFRILQEPTSAPLLFHCSAGKDRTGFAAALFLSSLGVDKQTIIEDYMMSADLVKEKYRPVVEKYPILEPIMTVKPEYIEAAFNEIDQHYGGMEHYLTECLNVDIPLMRKLYTE